MRHPVTLRPMTLLLHLVRHGETEHNRGQVTLGRADVPLNERGRALYREWLLERRPEQRAAIDAEIAAYRREKRAGKSKLHSGR